MIPEHSDYRLQEELKLVPIEQILVNPYQPRRVFKPEDLEELAQSIQAVGLIHPPLVRPLPDSPLFELISGERRFRAAQLAGLTAIPVFVRRTNHSTSAEAALIENIQRVDLNALEIAKALRQLMSEFNLNQEVIARRIGKKRSTVANYLRLLTLPRAIQESISKDLISMGHAKAILSLEDEAKQLLLHELILRDDLSVRETEKSAFRIAEKAVKQKLTYAPRNFYLEQLAAKLREHLGTRVSIQTKGKRGRVSFDYYGYDDLDRLLTLIGMNQEE